MHEVPSRLGQNTHFREEVRQQDIHFNSRTDIEQSKAQLTDLVDSRALGLDFLESLMEKKNSGFAPILESSPVRTPGRVQRKN